MPLFTAPEIHTKLGSLRGKYESVKGKDTGVHAYLGVPFAKPPVGPALRLAAPQPVEGWEGVRDATKQPLMCVQDLEFANGLVETFGLTVDLPDISEDCLYLNVYTPANRPENAKLPVMVWIHGGGFVLGSASSYSGSALAAYQDVVVVVIQYRLGLLGFLSTGDEHMPGNIGFLDQIQALKWVQEHIHNFGGDPDLVTIFGESAGGVSVSLLLLSPLSEGLFHRAIAESGTAAMQLLVQDDPQPALQMVANISGCSTESTEKTADCIKKLDMENILTIAKEKELRYPLITDGYFLKNNVEELFLQHQLLNVPFMTGVNNHEGSWLLAQYMAPPNWTEGMDQEHVLGMLSMFYPDPKDEQLRKQILDVYTGTGEDRVKNRDGYTEMLGDVLFVIPAIKAANAHRDAGAPVYLYEFQHSPSFLKDKRPSFVRSDHGDEIYSVFGFCFTVSHIKFGSACSEEDEQLDKIMMSYWGNFARTGSPNGQGLVHWPKYGEKQDYLAIDAKNQNVFQGLKKDKFVVLTQTPPENFKEKKGSRKKSRTRLIRGTLLLMAGWVEREEKGKDRRFAFYPEGFFNSELAGDRA
ncbi:Liver carboxylesterase [Takifugu flavidus]|uniref:Carboxylic ester hydrolase n=1 Tax=Takifugu flavidus TaxID=433684 RepID=A0A5C6P7W5_9TELE|nr:Liver carboxylesterase [Takifugu flavidus]